MRDKLLEARVIHCNETSAQVLKEDGRAPSSQSWMWVQRADCPSPHHPVVLFDYASSRGQDVPVRQLEGYRGYVILKGKL